MASYICRAGAGVKWLICSTLILTCMLRCILAGFDLDPCGAVVDAFGMIRKTLPTALVLPSRNTILCPGLIYSGCFMNRK